MKRVALSVVLALLGCGAGTRETSPPDPPGPCVPLEDSAAPTYHELFAEYFAPGTPGHCATARCHANPGANDWLCGESAESCYAGMTRVGLIDLRDPRRSPIADPAHSPLAWMSPSGDMPLDAASPLPEARDAILAWVAACAPND
ncbi:MAG TPA: hypothetical protein VGQ57_21100 [Polyangiaceae bacterium]|nr:hypothetical protein [Polyangiaceae bacterium]